MLPTADAEWVGAELARRFGLPLWSFTLTATDANRWAIRLARAGHREAEDLAFSLLLPRLGRRGVRRGRTRRRGGRPRPGNVGAPVALSETTTGPPSSTTSRRSRRSSAHGDVAAILTEPALTNIGIVLPEPGFLDGLRTLATPLRRLLMIDETHTFSAGPGGATAAWGLEPDIVVIGKSIGGGIPSGAYGMSREVAAARPSAVRDTRPRRRRRGRRHAGRQRALGRRDARDPRARPHRGPLRADDRAGRREFTAGVQDVLDRARRCRGRSASSAPGRSTASPRRAPRTGGESAAAADEDLDGYLHLCMANRGVLITPFHNMALMCPDTSAADVALHTRLFDEAVDGADDVPAT